MGLPCIKQQHRTTYDKALYRGYTGPDFTEQSVQPDWLGFNGPILRGEVGDMIEVRPPLPILAAT